MSLLSWLHLPFLGKSRLLKLTIFARKPPKFDCINLHKFDSATYKPEMKFWLYSSASLVACIGLLYYTYITRQQFYPSVIYLVTSKISVLILGNAGLVLTTLVGRLLKTVFFGTLRDAEVEVSSFRGLAAPSGFTDCIMRLVSSYCTKMCAML